MTDVTQMLRRWREGDPEARERVLPIVYEELRRLARGRLRGEREGHTLATTGLVHEAYLRLVDVDRVEWRDRAHFLGMASRTMRRVLIDYANQRNAAKRGGVRLQVPLDEHAPGTPGGVPDPDLDLDGERPRSSVGDGHVHDEPVPGSARPAAGEREDDGGGLHAEHLVDAGDAEALDRGAAGDDDLRRRQPRDLRGP